ncbi:MAG: biotin-dependent carboxyltransferase family protein [Betaproteobacteria bacterium]|nr:biotin-dependent carboxyltransferase family protein [Betaproteobacteria bacterium]
MSVEVIRPGLLTTVQDLGRFGYQRFGVVAGGVMDNWAQRLANAAVGNDEREATLEITMQGPVLRFGEPALVAVCGADLAPRIGSVPFPQGRPVLVRAGAVLEFRAGEQGCRAYLAIRGGFRVPVVMGSRSTYIRAALGGLEGRALKKGDRLPVDAYAPGWYPELDRALDEAKTPFAAPRWSVGFTAVPASARRVRVVAGPQWDLFSQETRELFLGTEFGISVNSDRMGYRLTGAMLKLRRPAEMISEAVTFGTVQVPPDGNPIILMADRQTTGGYPKIAQVAAVDLPRLAQARPLERFAFELVTLAEAQQAYLARERELAKIRESIDFQRRQ